MELSRSDLPAPADGWEHLLRLANSLAQEGAVERAVPLWREALAHPSWPSHPDGRPHDLAPSLAQAVRALSPQHLDPPLRMMLGRLSFGLGDMERAIPGLHLALQSHSDDPWLLAALGQALHHLGRNDKAAPLLLGSLKLRGDGNTSFWLAQALLGLNQKAPALQALRKAVELSPGVAGFRTALGRELSAGGQPGEAVVHLMRAAELAPTDARAWLAAADLVKTLGRPERALEMYRKALGLDPTLTGAAEAVAQLAPPPPPPLPVAPPPPAPPVPAPKPAPSSTPAIDLLPEPSAVEPVVPPSVQAEPTVASSPSLPKAGNAQAEGRVPEPSAFVQQRLFELQFHAHRPTQQHLWERSLGEYLLASAATRTVKQPRELDEAGRAELCQMYRQGARRFVEGGWLEQACTMLTTALMYDPGDEEALDALEETIIEWVDYLETDDGYLEAISLLEGQWERRPSEDVESRLLDLFSSWVSQLQRQGDPAGAKAVEAHASQRMRYWKAMKADWASHQEKPRLPGWHLESRPR